MMIDIDTIYMQEYELEKKDSIVNYIDDKEIKEFYERYIPWLEKRLNEILFC